MVLRDRLVRLWKRLPEGVRRSAHQGVAAGRLLREAAANREDLADRIALSMVISPDIDGTLLRLTGDVERLQLLLNRRAESLQAETNAATGQLREQLEIELRDVRESIRSGEAELAEIRRELVISRATMAAKEVADAVGHGEGGPASTALSQSIPAMQPPTATFANVAPLFGDIYSAFEDSMRGPRESIMQRLGGDYLGDLVSLPGQDLPVVDLGCGRGELVESLAALGQPAIGIDNNLSQLASVGVGQFVEAEVFQWLDARGSDTVRAIVATHLIEHVPVDLQVRLFFESYRVLAPGGIIIVETPNASSLAVGASTFWADPTHDRPVHPSFLDFLARQAGFVNRELRYLHGGAAEFRSDASDPTLLEQLNSLIFGAADVALVAQKPSTQDATTGS